MITLVYSNQTVSHTLGDLPFITDVIMNDLEVFVNESEENAVGMTSTAAEETLRSINQDLDSE